MPRHAEVAHIVPASQGGSMEDSNLIALCPNHHTLFDYGKLNAEEDNLIQHRLLEAC